MRDHRDWLQLDGKRAIVTGGGSGIGEAIATGLASAGAHVIVADISEEGAAATVDANAGSPGQVIAHRCDVANGDDVAELVGSAERELGGIDILVNNAGILDLSPALDVSEEAWDRVLGVNLKGAFLCASAVARVMVAQGTGGRIVNVSSIHALLSEPNAVHYTAAKGGLEAMSRTLASELAPHRITVNCVRPGATWTALSRPLYTEEVLAALMQRIPLREIGEPEWVADAVLFLASPRARYTTGSAIDVDGGYLMDGSLPSGSYQGSDAPRDGG